MTTKRALHEPIGFTCFKSVTVVSELLCDAANTIYAHTDTFSAADPNLGPTYDKASQNDAFTRINPRTGQKGKQMVTSTQVEAKHQGCQDVQAHRLKSKVVRNNSSDTRGSYVNFDPKDERINGTKYDLDLRHKPKRS